MPTGRESRHAGPGRPLRRRLRRPAAAAALCAGLLAIAGGTGGLLLAGPVAHPGISPRPVPRSGRTPAGTVVAPARPAAGAWVPRPVYLSIPAIDVNTRLITLGLTPQGTLQVPA